MDEEKSDSRRAILTNESKLNLLEWIKLVSKDKTIRKRQTGTSQKEGYCSAIKEPKATLKAPRVVVGKEIWWSEVTPNKRCNLQETELL